MLHLAYKASPLQLQRPRFPSNTTTKAPLHTIRYCHAPLRTMSSHVWFTFIMDKKKNLHNMDPRNVPPFLNNMLRYIGEGSWILALLSVFLAFYLAHRRQQHLTATSARDRRRTAKVTRLWRTSSWPTFFGLCDLYILGQLPVGPWKKEVDKSLKAWPEKRYLRRLVHMGIVPLYIQDGGIETRQEQTLKLSHDSPRITLPKYVQSKRRACFEFLIPMARGYSEPEYRWNDRRTHPFKRFVRTLLENHHNYLVTVSSVVPDVVFDSSHPPEYRTRQLEVGASSWVKLLLPFKEDRILQPAKGQVAQDISEFLKEGVCPLLETQKCPVVRIEVLDYRKRRLDEWIYGVAQQSGLGDVWKYGTLHAYTSEWIQANGYRMPPYTIPEADRM
jgi:hypothetical protein